MIKKKVLIAMDSLKGCLSAEEATRAAADAVTAMGFEAVLLPATDGGDGMLRPLARILSAELRELQVHDALMRPCTASYAITHDGTAIIETAEACGIMRLKKEELNPMVASTWGVGELLIDALSHGAHKLIVGLGGSATSDCGIGMLKALKDCYLRPRLESDDEDVWTRVPLPETDLLSDVRNPLYGADGAAAVFGPQKGATPEMVASLDHRARKFSEAAARHFGFDRSQEPGAGAAGGLGYAFMQFLGAKVHPGAEYFLQLAGFDSLLQDCCLVITGEGSADRQTLMGKLPSAVMQHARKANIPTLLLAGRVADRDQLMAAGFADAVCINDAAPATDNPLNPDTAKQNIARSTALWLEKHS